MRSDSNWMTFRLNKNKDFAIAIVFNPDVVCSQYYFTSSCRFRNRTSVAGPE
jgi:hypothetical protein